MQRQRGVFFRLLISFVILCCMSQACLGSPTGMERSRGRGLQSTNRHVRREARSPSDGSRTAGDGPQAVLHTAVRWPRPNMTGNEEHRVCVTDHCFGLANTTKSNMNTTMDPCDDFYNYACGNWPRNNPVPVGKTSWDSFSIVEQRVKERLHDALEAEDDKDDPSTARRKAKLYYRSCMDHWDDWETCVQSTRNNMNIAVGSLYVRRYFNESNKHKLAGMIRDLRQSVSIRLRKASWLDWRTKKQALAKLDLMTDYIGYPDYILNDTATLDEQYSTLTIDGDYFANYYRMSSFSQPTLHNTRFAGDGLIPGEANAFYDNYYNEIALQATILQPPFYDEDRPEYLNFAAIGTIIGHEFTHGFDDAGSHYDGEGTYSNWWSPESMTRYRERLAELRAKYSNYTLPDGSVVDGSYTLGENIADGGGVKMALHAYRLFVQRTGVSDSRLPGFESFSNEQMYFLGYAQTWCGAVSSGSAWEDLTDHHSPRQFRVIGPLSGMRHFAEAYQCPTGSRMNPSVELGVW